MSNLSRLPQNTAIGALLGAFLGVGLIGIGLLRAGVAIVAGSKMQPVSSQDARVLAYYVAGFAVAGALTGIARSVFSKRAGVVVGCLVGGVVVVFAILVGDKGSIRALDQSDLFISIVLGIVFGAAGAIGFLRSKEAA